MAAIRPTDHVLASNILLPPTPALALAIFTPAQDSQLPPHDAIELNRRALAAHSGSSAVLDRILTSVRCGRQPLLYVFLVTPLDPAAAALERLSKLQLEHLGLVQHNVFPLDDLASASPNVLAHFLDAVRTSILSDLSDSAATTPVPVRPQRLEDGFILERKPTSSDWAAGWDNGINSRPVVHFRLQIQISFRNPQPSHLVLHAIPISTPYSTLPSSPIQGTPIILLPYGTPAYYLNTYNGPSNTLVKQFRESLRGLGVGGWEDCPSPSFIIGWIRVENRQGEDKGTLFVWPSRLCLSYSDRHSLPSLDYIPEMPAPLQSSPQVPQEGGVVNEAPAEPRYSENPLHQAWPSEPHQLPPHSDPLRAFYSLTVSKSKDIRSLANEVGGYVDSVVRDRERERERLKKERELGTTTSPKLARYSAVPSRPALSTSLPSTSSAIPAHIPEQHLNAHQAQIFYPSPPQSGQVHPPPTHNTSPDLKAMVDLPPPSQPAPPPERVATIPPTPPHPEVSSGGFDPFNNASNWPQSSDSYMDMNMEMDFAMDMDMDFNMDMNSSRSTATATYTNHHPTLNFEDAFTDDDFSFFDQPSKLETPAPIPHVPFNASDPMDLNLSRPSALLTGPSSILDDTRATGPGPPLPPGSANGPWTPATQGDGQTPQTFDPFDSRAPDLIPSSPGQSSEPHSLPETPSVQLIFEPSVKPSLTTNEHGPILFDAIPFSTSHKSNDTKYSFGKFALPTPGPEPRYDSSPSPPPTSATPRTWRARYNSITDPRFNVVQQLIGVKRKGSPIPHTRNDSFGSAWLDVEENTPTDTNSALVMDISSDTDSEEDDNYDDESDCDSPQLSRPATPPPSYLPLGPTLLHFRFDHSQLLPLSIPLRSPDAIGMPTTLAPLPSVPTPVSPAAALGAASEQSKSLESAAFAIAAEFVENPLWAETWKANNQRTIPPAAVWPDDVKGAADFLQRMHGLSNLSTLFDLDASTKLESYEPPYISVGKGEAVIQLLPSALRFWEKLGLGPKGGRKDLEVYAFYEDADDQKRTLVDTWLSTAAASYKARQMGQFIRGCTNPANDALLPIRFDVTFRKTLVSFISNIINAALPIVVMLFVPVTAMSMDSPVLRQVLSSSKKALTGFTERQIIFHLVPDSHLVDIEHSPKGYPLLDDLCNSIYNRVHVSVERHLSRRMHGLSAPTSFLFQEPNLTLARPLHSKVTYVRAAHSSLDIVDRFTLLHAGYQVSPCKKWLFACCVDQRGEEYNLGLWLIQPSEEGEGESEKVSEEASIIEKVWNFALDFARKANVEWRMIITKLGIMSPAEIQAWTDRIAQEESLGHPDFAPLHIVLASADRDSPWTLVDSNPVSSSPTRIPRSTSTTRSNNMHFSDISASFYALFPENHISATVPPKSNSYSTSLVCEPAPSSPSQEATPSGDTSPSRDDEDLPHPIPFIPLSTSTLVRVPCQPSETPIRMLHTHILKHFQPPGYPTDPEDTTSLHKDVTRNFYELAILSATRFRLNDDPILPFHLAAIDSMRTSLDCAWEHLDGSTEP